MEEEEDFLTFTPVPTVESPCIGVCRIGDDRLCQGCRRTIDEIAIWSATSDDHRRAILNAVAGRGQPRR